MDADTLVTGAVQLLIVVLAMSVHEAAHAFTAERCGDPTPRLLGRVSLNPLRHADLFGSLLLPLAMVLLRIPPFGWGRPGVVVARNLRGRRSALLVAAAGPAANLAMGAVAAAALAVAVRVLGAPARDAAAAALQWSFLRDPAAAGLAHFPLLFTLVQLSYLSAVFALFHLLPVPPLDGGQILLELLPADWAARYAALRPYGFMIAMGLAMLGVLTLASAPIVVALWLVIQL
jgi:Zn-dependent protease